VCRKIDPRETFAEEDLVSAVKRYDDIVIGAGTSGVPLAVRLSEDSARQVALVEAGPDYPTADVTPSDLLSGNSMSLVQHNWQFAAEILAGRQVSFPQGRVAGGSSAIGNTVCIRGMPGDYDEWAAAGNSAWSWQHALPYFRMLEDDLDFAGEYHGQGGPIPIRRFRPDHLVPVQQSFYDACLDAGFPLCEDHNHPDSTGVGPMPSNRSRGDITTRVSTAAAYLPLARARENFTIVPDTVVNRVLIEDGHARGVELLSGSAVHELRGRRVILAAGAVSSPAILIRSGIGPADDLRRLGIDVRADLPGVGAGLADQPRVGVFMTPKPGEENYGLPTSQIVMRTTSATTGERNDMYYAMVSHFDLTYQFSGLRPFAAGPRVLSVMAVIRRAHARGRVTVTSTDPREAPRISLNYLDNEHDYQILAEGVRNCWKLAQAPKIRDRGEQLVMLDESGIDSEDVVRDYIKISVESAYNPVGTARMGPGSDPGSVVDERCEVHGVAGLYVADASIMPAMVRGNTKLTVIMIGERVAAQLRGELPRRRPGPDRTGPARPGHVIIPRPHG
jgi:choline dehydrogenase